MQYTIRDIPEHVDKALREKAEGEHTSLNRAAIDALEAGLGLSGTPMKYRDLSDIAGTWVEDPEFDRAIEELRQIDLEDWK